MASLIYFCFYFGSHESSISLVELSLTELLHSIKIDEIELRLLLLFFKKLFFPSLLIKANQSAMFHIYTCTFFHVINSD